MIALMSREQRISSTGGTQRRGAHLSRRPGTRMTSQRQVRVQAVYLHIAGFNVQQDLQLREFMALEFTIHLTIIVT